jgi:hypothetical protein
MSETLYKKVGKKYVPVREMDVVHAYPAGYYLIRIQPGITSTTPLKLHPRHAQLEVALLHFKDDLVTELSKASEIKTNKPVTGEQRVAWDNMLAVFGDDMRMFYYGALYDIATVALEKLQDRIIEYNNAPLQPISG